MLGISMTVVTPPAAAARPFSVEVAFSRESWIAEVDVLVDDSRQEIATFSVNDRIWRKLSVGHLDLQ